jgi:hypothetical protein
MVALLAGRRRRPSGCASRATERPPRLEFSRAWMSLGAQRIAHVSCSGRSCCIAGQLEPVLRFDSLRCSSLGSCRGRSSRPARRRQPSQRLLWPSTSMSPLSSRQPSLKQTRPASLAVREMRLTAPPAELLSRRHASSQTGWSTSSCLPQATCALVPPASPLAARRGISAGAFVCILARLLDQGEAEVFPLLALLSLAARRSAPAVR